MSDRQTEIVLSACFKAEVDLLKNQKAKLVTALSMLKARFDALPQSLFGKELGIESVDIHFSVYDEENWTPKESAEEFALEDDVKFYASFAIKFKTKEGADEQSIFVDFHSTGHVNTYVNDNKEFTHPFQWRALTAEIIYARALQDIMFYLKSDVVAALYKSHQDYYGEQQNVVGS